MNQNRSFAAFIALVVLAAGAAAAYWRHRSGFDPEAVALPAANGA